MTKALVVCYSRAGENYFAGALRRIEKGNTLTAAEWIAADLGADLYQIEQEVPYADDYNTCIQQAQQDQRHKARPRLKQPLPDLAPYTDIYLGTPNYWGTMPMAVFTFLESCSWQGKRIHPFCTHEGSGFGRILEDLKKACPGAEVCPGLAVQGTQIPASKDKICRWAEQQ